MLWVVVIYAFFTAVTVREQKPTLEEGINGAWLLAVVATQSVAVLGRLLAPASSTRRDAVALLRAAPCSCSAAMLYIC